MQYKPPEEPERVQVADRCNRQVSLEASVFRWSSVVCKVADEPVQLARKKKELDGKLQTSSRQAPVRAEDGSRAANHLQLVFRTTNIFGGHQPHRQGSV